METPTPIVPHRTRYDGLLLCSAVCISLLLAGCSTKPDRGHYQTLPKPLNRDSRAAERLNDEGMVLIEAGKLNEAEPKFREALENDLFYASAHNNLGLVLLRTDRHYEAAWEFDYAAKLVPHAGEPRNNLGLLYEKLGRLDSAIEAYDAALQIDPQNTVAMRHLARVLVKANRNDDRVKTLFEKLLAVPGDGQWDTWVRGQALRLGRHKKHGTSFSTKLSD